MIIDHQYLKETLSPKVKSLVENGQLPHGTYVHFCKANTQRDGKSHQFLQLHANSKVLPKKRSSGFQFTYYLGVPHRPGDVYAQLERCVKDLQEVNGS